MYNASPPLMYGDGKIGILTPPLKMGVDIVLQSTTFVSA